MRCFIESAGDHIPGKQPADPAECCEGPARVLGGNDINACTETGVECRLKKRPLPTHRPVLEKRKGVIDRVNLFDGFVVFQ